MSFREDSSENFLLWNLRIRPQLEERKNIKNNTQELDLLFLYKVSDRCHLFRILKLIRNELRLE